MCHESSRTIPALVDSTDELKLDRRAALLGAGCVALAAILPGGAQAAGWARTRVRSAVATLPRQSPIDFHESEITFVNRLPRIRFGGFPDDPTLLGAGPVRGVRRFDQPLETPDRRLPGALPGEQQPGGAATQRPEGAKRCGGRLR